MQINYDKLAEFAHPRMVEAVRRYIENHAPIGAFLTAVVCNDLRLAVGYADSDNLAHLREWVQFFHFEAPGQCHGSPEKMAAWQKARRAEAA